MASRALGAMFGGLADFIKLRRGLNQDTENREFLTKQRDLSLRGGEQGLELGDVQLQTGRTNLARLPQRFAMEDIDFQSRLAGPEGITREALNSVISDPSIGDGLFKGLQRQVSRNATNDQILGSQATLQGNAAERSNLQLGALKDVQSNPGDPINNQADVTRYAVAGLPEATRPAAGLSRQWGIEDREDSQRQATALQGSAQGFQREMATMGVPEGVSPQNHAMFGDWIKTFQQESDRAQLELQQVRREIADNQSRIQRASLLPQGGLQESREAQAALQEAQRREAEISRGLVQQGNALLTSIQGLLGPERSLPYRAQLDNLMVRARTGARPPANGPAPSGAAAGVIEVN